MFILYCVELCSQRRLPLLLHRAGTQLYIKLNLNFKKNSSLIKNSIIYRVSTGNDKEMYLDISTSTWQFLAFSTPGNTLLSSFTSYTLNNNAAEYLQ